MAKIKSKKLGELLLEAKIMTAQQLADALDIAKSRPGKRLGEIIIEQKYINEEKLNLFLSEQLNVPIIDLFKNPPDPALTNLIPSTVVRKFKAVPHSKNGDILTVVTPDPLNIFAIDTIEEITNCEVKLALASDGEINSVLASRYSVDAGMSEILAEIDRIRPKGGTDSTDDLAKLTEETPVVRLVNTMLNTAVQQRASDIHLESDSSGFMVRFRIDGVLYEAMRPPVDIAPLLLSRLKVMAGLDIAERRLPQDGRFQTRLNANSKEVDFRVSTIPCVQGENMVIRILSKGDIVLSLEKVGLSHNLLEKMNKLIKQPQGMIIATGPTGSGKTSTLYAAISSINTISRKIITIEDPVEYKFNLVNQIPVNKKFGISFAEGIKSILRQDPDVIMVGEIRDPETAMLAVEAALTGHLVLSTLHTNSAAATITRLFELRVEPYLINSSVTGILAQRLLRQNCPYCTKIVKPSENLLREFGLDPNGEYKGGTGCSHCHESGFRGRLVIGEMMVITEKIRSLISDRQDSTALNQAAISEGMITLAEDGAQLVKQGKTTVEELSRGILRMEI